MTKPDAEAPATNGSVRHYFRWLSLQNGAVLLAILGALGFGGQKLLGWLVGEAVAQDGGYVTLEKRVTALESGQAELRALTIRQLEEGRANATWVMTGRRPAILDEPLPAKDAGR